MYLICETRVVFFFFSSYNITINCIMKYIIRFVGGTIIIIGTVGTVEIVVVFVYRKC